MTDYEVQYFLKQLQDNLVNCCGISRNVIEKSDDFKPDSNLAEKLKSIEIEELYIAFKALEGLKLKDNAKE